MNGLAGGLGIRRVVGGLAIETDGLTRESWYFGIQRHL